MEDSEKSENNAYSFLGGFVNTTTDIATHGIDSPIPTPKAIGYGIEITGLIATQISDGDLTERDVAETIGGFATSVATGMLTGAAIGGLPGVLGGAIAGALTGPYGERLGGALYDSILAADYDTFDNISQLPDIYSRAYSRLTGFEAAYSRAIANGDAKDVARAAMDLPGVYADGPLRAAAGYPPSNGSGLVGGTGEGALKGSSGNDPLGYSFSGQSPIGTTPAEYVAYARANPSIFALGTLVSSVTTSLPVAFSLNTNTHTDDFRESINDAVRSALSESFVTTVDPNTGKVNGTVNDGRNNPVGLGEINPGDSVGQSTGDFDGGSAPDTGPGIGDLRPIILDITRGNIEITELSKSTVFMDSSGDGLLNRTA